MAETKSYRDEIKHQKRERIRDLLEQSGYKIMSIDDPKKKEMLIVPKRVAAYVHLLNTSDTAHYYMSAHEKLFKEDIATHSNWSFVGFFCDTGIGNYTELEDLLRLCKEGEVDIIITHGIMRFGRNFVDLKRIVGELSELNPEVGVYFADYDLYSLQIDFIKEIAMLTGGDPNEN